MDLNNSNNCSSTNNNNNNNTTTTTTTKASNDTLNVSSILLNYDNCNSQSIPLSIVSDTEPFKENCCNNNNDVKNVKT